MRELATCRNCGKRYDPEFPGQPRRGSNYFYCSFSCSDARQAEVEREEQQRCGCHEDDDTAY